MSDTQELLRLWEQSYKKGLLSFWLLLALSQRPMYAYEMNEQIKVLSQSSISADENSIYRALRRFAQVGLIRSKTRPSEVGPARKYYQLTKKGSKLLASFIERNILFLQSKEIQKTIAAFMHS